MANFHRAAMEFFLPGEPDLICDIWTEIARNLAAELQAEGWPQLSPEEFMARREVVDYRVMERLRARVDSLVEDQATAEALKPWYRYLCKRPLSSNDYYSVFNQPNVSLVDVADSRGLERITEAGISVELVDLRTVSPWDRETVLASAAKTGRVLVAHEAVRSFGPGAEIASTVAEELFGQLKAPVRRLGAPYSPVPFAKVLEDAYIVSPDQVVEAVKGLMA